MPWPDWAITTAVDTTESWATVWKGVKWMTSPGAPLLVNPTPTWHKISWMAAFVGNIPRYEENTVTTVRLALEARRRLTEIAAAAEFMAAANRD